MTNPDSEIIDFPEHRSREEQIGLAIGRALVGITTDGEIDPRVRDEWAQKLRNSQDAGQLNGITIPTAQGNAELPIAKYVAAAFDQNLSDLQNRMDQDPERTVVVDTGIPGVRLKVSRIPDNASETSNLQQTTFFLLKPR